MNNRLTQMRLDRQSDRSIAQFDTMSPKDGAEKLEYSVIDERQAVAANGQMRINALYVIFMLSAIVAEADYDDEEMLPSEVLDALMTEVFTEDDDDDNDVIDEIVIATLSAHVSDALSTLGVEDDIIQDLFDDEVEVADAAAIAAAETVLENMPADGKEFDAFVAAFAYTDDVDSAESDEDVAAFDSMGEVEYQFDAAGKKLRVGKRTVKKVNGVTLTYKAVKAIRNGEKVTINKRIMGKPKLKASQKAALKKARIKAGTPSVIRKQMKSFRKGLKMNIYKGNPDRLRALYAAGASRHNKAAFSRR